MDYKKIIFLLLQLNNESYECLEPNAEVLLAVDNLQTKQSGIFFYFLEINSN